MLEHWMLYLLIITIIDSMPTFKSKHIQLLGKLWRCYCCFCELNSIGSWWQSHSCLWNVARHQAGQTFLSQCKGYPTHSSNVTSSSAIVLFSVHVYMHSYTQTCTHTHTRTQTHMLAHTHTHTQHKNKVTYTLVPMKAFATSTPPTTTASEPTANWPHIMKSHVVSSRYFTLPTISSPSSGSSWKANRMHAFISSSLRRSSALPSLESTKSLIFRCRGTNVPSETEAKITNARQGTKSDRCHIREKGLSFIHKFNMPIAFQFSYSKWL